MARWQMRVASCAASTISAKTVRVAVVRVDVHLARVVAVMRSMVVHHVVDIPALRVVRLRVVRAIHTAAGATINRLRRTAMIVRRVRAVVLAVVIAVVRVGPALINHVRIHRVRTIPARRVLQASRMGKAVRHTRVALPRTPATPPNSAAGTCPKVSTPARARRGRVAIRIHRGRTRGVPAPVARTNPVVDTAAITRRAAPARMPVRMQDVRSLRARMAIAPAPMMRVEIVRKAACHAARTPAPVVTARKPIVPAAIVRTHSINVAPAAIRRTRVRMVNVRIAPTHRVARKFRAPRVTKGCRATRIDVSRSLHREAQSITT